MGSNLGFISGEHGHWVKPKNITIIFVTEYDDDFW